MEFKPPSAEDVRKTFLEKAQDPKYFFLISSLFLYLDIAISYITGQNLIDFRFSEIEKSIPIGKVVCTIAPYFLILYLAPKVRFWLQCICVDLRLNWILEKIPGSGWNHSELTELRQDSRVVSLGELKRYALIHNQQVLYNFVLAQEEIKDALWKIASLSFAFWILAIVDVYFSWAFFKRFNFPAPCNVF
jgi:hypothetical protein